MHILVIRQYYPEGSHNPLDVSRACQYWARLGHNVAVITSNLDPDTGSALARYNGYPLVREVDGKVVVYRCSIPGSGRRGLQELGFALTASLVALTLPNPDVVVAVWPIPATAVPGWVAARCRLKPVPWLIDSDQWLEFPRAIPYSKQSPLKNPHSHFERWLWDAASRVRVTASQTQEFILSRRLAGCDKLIYAIAGVKTSTHTPDGNDLGQEYLDVLTNLVGARQDPWRCRVKRGLDIAIAALGLALFSPVMIAVGAAIRISLGSPVFFRQTRPGHWGRPFEIVKFRTMMPAMPGQGVESDAERLTLLGRFVRATSLDELPTLWNVLVGDMSLVGPRPLLTQYLDRYTPRQRRRHLVKPGVTGWAQVNGRNAVGWAERLELDVWYVENWNLWLDLKILARTVSTVLRRKGVAAPGLATMSEFTGGEQTV